MVRTVISVVVLLFAVFFLPFWAQALLFIGALFFARYRVVLLLPALVADQWYAPVHSVAFQNNKTFLFALALLCLYFVIISKTRIVQKYGLETK